MALPSNLSSASSIRPLWPLSVPSSSSYHSIRMIQQVHLIMAPQSWQPPREAKQKHNNTKRCTLHIEAWAPSFSTLDNEGGRAFVLHDKFSWNVGLPTIDKKSYTPFLPRDLQKAQSCVILKYMFLRLRQGESWYWELPPPHGFETGIRRTS